MNASTQKLSLWERGNRIIGRRFSTYLQRLVLYRTQKALSQLSDHMLRDIGLTREDIAVGHFERRISREPQARGRGWGGRLPIIDHRIFPPVADGQYEHQDLPFIDPANDPAVAYSITPQIGSIARQWFDKAARIARRFYGLAQVMQHISLRGGAELAKLPLRCGLKITFQAEPICDLVNASSLFAL